MIKITFKEESPLKHKTDCLVVPCVETEKPAGFVSHFKAPLGRAIAAAQLNQTLWLDGAGTLGAVSLILTGLGKAGDLTEDRLRQAAGTAARLAEKSRCRSVSLLVEKDLLNSKDDRGYHPQAAALAEGAALGLYHFDDYKDREKLQEETRTRSLTLVADPVTGLDGLAAAARRALHIAQAVTTARDLALHPGNRATPSFLAKTAKRLAGKNRLTCRVLGPKEMKQLGMGALLGVSRGSDEPPALIVLEYKGGKAKDSPVALVGKGITFDTGGISLKPPANMDEMKMDMSGGAAVIGALEAAAGLKLPVNVVGLVPAAENMPGGSAIKPGDVLASLSGKTIEVLNTDAEGRLVLADALAYAARFKPRAVIDLATLTGAVIVALGHGAAAVLGTDQALAEGLIASGERTGERLWQLPLWEEHEKALKSNIADLKNIAAPGVGAGTITGAAFLKAFAGEQPWAHIDIAGTAWSGEDKPYTPKGASGFGVRLLLDFLENLPPEEKTPGKKAKKTARKK
jgi:leucyl aminopeptidase